MRTWAIFITSRCPWTFNNTVTFTAKQSCAGQLTGSSEVFNELLLLVLQAQEQTLLQLDSPCLDNQVKNDSGKLSYAMPYLLFLLDNNATVE